MDDPELLSLAAQAEELARTSTPRTAMIWREIAAGFRRLAELRAVKAEPPSPLRPPEPAVGKPPARGLRARGAARKRATLT